MPISTKTSNSTSNANDSFAALKDKFQSLSADEQLAALWYIYDGLGETTIENPDDNKESDSSSDLYNQLQEKPEEQQLQFMRDVLSGADRDVLSGADNDLTSAYSQLSNTTKIALWYRLGEGMSEGSVIQVPSDYELSDEAEALLEDINSVGFEQKYILLRDILLG